MELDSKIVSESYFTPYCDKNIYPIVKVTMNYYQGKSYYFL